VNNSDIISLFMNVETIVGCGQHKDAVLRNIPVNKRCTCNASGQNPEQRHVQSPRLASQLHSRYK
jgi:hypothetical protein